MHYLCLWTLLRLHSPVFSYSPVLTSRLCCRRLPPSGTGPQHPTLPSAWRVRQKLKRIDCSREQWWNHPALVWCSTAAAPPLSTVRISRWTNTKTRVALLLLQVADFLARDFSSAEGRAAASKNAFHLLGQHRYSLAAGKLRLGGCHRRTA
jgi:hypothetical protein